MDNKQIFSYLNIKTNTTYVLWYHTIDNDKWTLESYNKIIESNDLNDVMYFIKKKT